MSDTPSPDDRELIEHMDVLLAGFAGENDLRVGPHMLAEGVKKVRDRLESLLADRAKLEEALKPFAKIAELRESYNDPEGAMVVITVEQCREARAALRSADRG